MSDIREQIKAAKTAAKLAAKAAMKQRTMEDELEYIMSDDYQQKLVVDASIERLDHLAKKVEKITGNTAYAVFGYEQRVGKLLGLLKLIAYTANGKGKVRDKVKAITRLDEVTLQKFISCAGKTAFYSSKYDEIVEEIRPNVEELKSVLTRAAAIIGVVVDIELFTEEAVDGVYEYARNKAVEAAEGDEDMQQIAEPTAKYMD